ncbi:hypothetical protein KC929_02310 [Patescibacteria group bacterium]|nr:hypothetical protein [Patescibacteria group bacterium]
MKKQYLKSYISNFVIIFAIFGVLYFVLWLFIPGEWAMADLEVSTLVHEGRLEIEQNFRETGEYSYPKVTSQKIYDLGYNPDFELKENGGYTYSVILDTGIDEAYCIHNDGHAGRYVNWGCDLDEKI